MTLAQMMEGLRDAYKAKARIYSITLTGIEVGPILKEYDDLRLRSVDDGRSMSESEW